MLALKLCRRPSEWPTSCITTSLIAWPRNSSGSLGSFSFSLSFLSLSAPSCPCRRPSYPCRVLLLGVVLLIGVGVGCCGHAPGPARRTASRESWPRRSCRWPSGPGASRWRSWAWIGSQPAGTTSSASGVLPSRGATEPGSPPSPRIAALRAAARRVPGGGTGQAVSLLHRHDRADDLAHGQGDQPRG